MSEKFKEGEVIVRPATREDMAAVAEMIQELADFQKMPQGPKLSAQDLERDCFELSPAAFQCLVAGPPGPPGEAAGGAAPLLGYAVYFPSYSTWEGRALALEDLYVRPDARRRGVGRLLFNAVAKEASAVGSRLDFHVLEENPARAFYEASGARNLTHAERWCCYRLAGDQLASLARTS